MELFDLHLDAYGIALLSVAAASFIYLVVKYATTFFRVGRFKGKGQEEQLSEALPPVSIVMVVHNDADKLRKHLPSLLEQDYPDYEIVVVDYQSHDDTSFVLQVCAANYPHLKKIGMGQDVNFFQGKKYPLSLGIRSAKKDIILLIDPDCEPGSLLWLRSMVAGYKGDGTQMVLGATRLVAKNNLLGWFQQYDNLVYNCRYLSSAMARHPYTGCGRNLSYRREFFFDNGGFIRHYVEPEGADDLFVNQNASSSNAEVALSPDSFVNADAATTFYDWFYLRRQRVSTRCYYSFARRLAIVLRPLMLVLFYAACILMLVNGILPWYVPAAMLLVKAVWQIICVAQACKRFSLKNYHWLSPFMELYFLVADTILSIIALHPKRCK